MLLAAPSRRVYAWAGPFVVSPSCGRPRAVFASFPGGCSVPFRGVAWRGVAWCGVASVKDVDADGRRQPDPTSEPKICYNRL